MQLSSEAPDRNEDDGLKLLDVQCCPFAQDQGERLSDDFRPIQNGFLLANFQSHLIADCDWTLVK